MNNHKPNCYISAIVILMVLTISTTVTLAQGNSSNEDLLIGTWALDYNKSIGQIQANSRSHYDTLKQESKNRIKANFSGRKITFQQDGGYILELRPGKQASGTWQLLADERTLQITFENGKEHEQRIESINAGKMLLNLGGQQMDNRLFRKWHLNKISEN